MSLPINFSGLTSHRAVVSTVDIILSANLREGDLLPVLIGGQNTLVAEGRSDESVAYVERIIEKLSTYRAIREEINI